MEIKNSFSSPDNYNKLIYLDYATNDTLLQPSLIIMFDQDMMSMFVCSGTNKLLQMNGVRP